MSKRNFADHLFALFVYARSITSPLHHLGPRPLLGTPSLRWHTPVTHTVWLEAAEMERAALVVGGAVEDAEVGGQCGTARRLGLEDASNSVSCGLRRLPPDSTAPRRGSCKADTSARNGINPSSRTSLSSSPLSRYAREATRTSDRADSNTGTSSSTTLGCLRPGLRGPVDNHLKVGTRRYALRERQSTAAVQTPRRIHREKPQASGTIFGTGQGRRQHADTGELRRML
ncbi:unnamed protein product [Tilletia controversa]|nr:unnamed protein product [Tilletia controversa]